MRAIFYLRGGGEETNGWPACLPASHSYAPRNGKSVYIVWSVCVYGPSFPPLLLLPFPPAWDGNYFHETKVAAIILPDPIPEGQQQQQLLLHANGITVLVHVSLVIL